MKWNYRLVEYDEGAVCGLHEVYYSDDGNFLGVAERPTIVMDSPQSFDVVVGQLREALGRPTIRYDSLPRGQAGVGAVREPGHPKQPASDEQES